jgi:hypothetical protein
MKTRSASGIVLLAALMPAAARTQVILQQSAATATIEAYLNASLGRSEPRDGAAARGATRASADGAVRALLRSTAGRGVNVGARLVLESSAERGVRVGEASALLFGRAGRLEIGRRQGLPDVLSGYAPNNFTFTSAEFGPASGASLDPGGGLVSRMLPTGARADFDELAGLGFAATLSEDRAARALYVSPKRKGFLAGLAVAPQAEDHRFGRLYSAGLTHETYWSQNVLRIGAAYNHAERKTAPRDLHSLNAGAALTWHEDWLFGISATWNGNSGGASTSSASPSAWGVVSSANYNHGPGTVGLLAQRARAARHLDLIEAGASYRFSTRMRLYGAIAHVQLSDEPAFHRGYIAISGLRFTL